METHITPLPEQNPSSPRKLHPAPFFRFLALSDWLLPFLNKNESVFVEHLFNKCKSISVRDLCGTFFPINIIFERDHLSGDFCGFFSSVSRDSSPTGDAKKARKPPRKTNDRKMAPLFVGAFLR